MFDKLIVSEPEGADFKNRRSYFLVSSVIVGALFGTALVISIFAADIGLGNGGFELSELVAPPEMAAVEPETPKPQQATTNQSQSQLPTRRDNIARIDETIPVVPDKPSVVPNTGLPRPLGKYKVGIIDTNPVDPGGNVRNATGSNSDGNGIAITPQVTESAPDPEPPIVKVTPPRRAVSIGVANGKATYLPKPTYSAAAIAVHADGKVDVQVTIDETGRVTSANAVSGHVLLRSAAEQAARNAKFTPTLLSNVPVKVTGVIVYNFVR